MYCMHISYHTLSFPIQSYGAMEVQSLEMLPKRLEKTRKQETLAQLSPSELTKRRENTRC